MSLQTVARRYASALADVIIERREERQVQEEVDQWMEKAKQAGGTVFSEPQNYLQGYTFGFADPDGHKFNVLYWPGM